MFKVFDKPCDQCLFSDNKIVSQERAKDVVASCIKKQTHFVCHKASMVGETTCCYAFYKKHMDDIQKLQIFTRLNMINFIPAIKDNNVIT